MDRLGFGGIEKVAATLARAGSKLSRETVRRYRHEAPVRPKPERSWNPRTEPLRAKWPNDLWFLDITQVKALFGFRRFRIAAVLDAFSRMPLAVRVFALEPGADDLGVLLKEAVRRHGPPGLFVSDHGAQFTAREFEATLGGIPHRFGAVGRSGSIALIERFWRTKERLQLPLFRPLTPAVLQDRLAYAVLHYTYLRPHHALAGATPAEAFFSWPRSRERAKAPPRGTWGRGSPDAPFRIDFLDPRETYPILTKVA